MRRSAIRALAATAMALVPLLAPAQLVNAPEGLYSVRDTPGEIPTDVLLIVDGFPAVESFLEDALAGFARTAEQQASEGVTITVSTEVSEGGNFKWTLIAETDDIVPTVTTFVFESELNGRVTIGENELRELRVRTQTLTISAGPIQLSDEVIAREQVTSTFLYSADPTPQIELTELTEDLEGDEEPFQVVTTYLYDLTGTGQSAQQPLVPPGADWTEIVEILIPVIALDDTVWADPPFASRFDYEIRPQEVQEVRFAAADLVDGFGQVELLVPPTDGADPVPVGQYGAGLVDLRPFTENNAGALRFAVRFLDREPDLAQTAPYPIGFRFTQLGIVNVAFSTTLSDASGPTRVSAADALIDRAVADPGDLNNDQVFDAADIQSIDEASSPTATPAPSR